MCGLVGVAGSMARNDVEVFHNMLLWDVVRGPDSTGVAAVKRGTGDSRGWDIFKRPEPSYWFQEHKLYEKTASIGNAALIGHNRKATVGKVNTANSHPFGFENIVGCHNGSIPWADRTDIPDHNKFDTDSEAIFYNLDIFGPEQFIPTLRGAYALVWYDKRDHSINMLRNDERPLIWAFSESRQTLYWASEAWMIHGALARNNIKMEKAWILTENSWNKFLIPEKFNDKFEEPIQVKVEGKKADPARFQNDAAAYGYYGCGDRSEWIPPHKRAQAARNASGTPVGELGTKKSSDEKATEENGKTSSATVEDVGSQRSLLRTDNDTDTPFDDDVPFGGASGTWSEAKAVTINEGRSNERIDQAITGWRGEYLSPKTFKSRTHEVCAGCDEVINFTAIWEGTDKVKFINSNQFVCETCDQDPWAAKWFVEDKLIGNVGRTRH